MMVLLKSYLPHAVLARRGVRQRISIASNPRKEPFPGAFALRTRRHAEPSLRPFRK